MAAASIALSAGLFLLVFDVMIVLVVMASERMDDEDGKRILLGVLD